MIYPEGARNGSENLPVRPLFSGTAKMAMETDTPIVPVAIEQYGKKFVINFGNELCPADFQSAADLTQTLRDALATLKWDIWENEGVQDKAGLPEDYSKQFRDLLNRKSIPMTHQKQLKELVSIPRRRLNRNGKSKQWVTALAVGIRRN